MRKTITSAIGAISVACGVLFSSASGSPRPAQAAALSEASTAARSPIHAPLRAEGAEIEGRWTLDQKRDGRLQLSVIYEHSNWGNPVDRAEFQGLEEAQVTAATSTPVAFRMEREPGRFDMEGTFRAGKGVGHFVFHPNRAFTGTLRSLGVEGAENATDRELMHLALAGANAAELRELASMDLGQLTLENVIELFIFDITPEYVRSVRSMNIAGTNSVRGVVEMRIHNITPEYVRELASLGYRDLSRQELLQMGIHGVTAETVREYREMGYGDLSSRQIVAMRIHGVTPRFVRDMRAAGVGELTPDGLVEMRIHNLTPEYIREMESLGFSDLSRRQLLQMSIHGVTPAFVREVREAGFQDVTPETLVRMKIHGIDAAYMRAAGRRGR